MGGPGSGPGEGLVYDRSTILTLGDQTMTLAQWARHLGHSSHMTITRRLTLGWSIERALTTPTRRYRKKE